MQILGERPGCEGRRVDPIDRRIELDRGDQVRRWIPTVQGALVETLRQTLGDVTWVVGEALAGGVDAVQLREKELSAAIRARFAALETDDPLAGYSDKIERRFTGPQESG